MDKSVFDTAGMLEPFDSQFFHGTALGTCVVLGGSGYVGSCLAWTLAQMVAPGLVNEVIVMDVKPPPAPLLRLKQVSYCEAVLGAGVLEQSSREIFERANGGSVFYVASSSPRDLNGNTAYAVNVLGVEEALQLARMCGVRSFIYTSTHNVVFDGKRSFRMADEMTAPIPKRHMDAYSATKAEGERRVLGADGILDMRTCALRPCGIYGPGENFHFERQRALALVGLHSTRILPILQKSMDWVYVSNVVDAHILAAQVLHKTDPKSRKNYTAGRAFFISENNPAPCLQTFFHPMFFAGGIRIGRVLLAIPWPFAHALALGAEFYARLTGTYPILSRMEVAKLRIEHTFSSKRAVVFGYKPRVVQADGVLRCCAFEKTRPRAAYVQAEARNARFQFALRASFTFLLFFLNLTLCLWILTSPIWL
ncbi:Short-chain dehydrogenase/reductase family 42E member 1 [Porphyridium purpureum]|uniref:Short-chain dehydrogenase/reductase family 42E member 1 n=1 Tax=Porphyridium purpureum TaxID=35688 RepID=A0A5J4YQK7_PORPP|nr:Short-chain dehydrogenase/reductase family 42E member 1 [Porphyridium purpureum]|eukprot:POR1483..scf236_6